MNGCLTKMKTLACCAAFQGLHFFGNCIGLLWAGLPFCLSIPGCQCLLHTEAKEKISGVRHSVHNIFPVRMWTEKERKENKARVRGQTKHLPTLLSSLVRPFSIPIPCPKKSTETDCSCGTCPWSAAAGVLVYASCSCVPVLSGNVTVCVKVCA